VTKETIFRKIFHLLILLIPTSFYFLGKWQFIQIIAPLALIIISIDYFRGQNSKINDLFTRSFGIIMKDKEKSTQSLTGVSYMLISACLCFTIFKGEFAIIAFVILAISDPLAAVIGMNYGQKKFFEKTLAGSLTFFISALIILVSFGIIYDYKLWYYIFGTFAVFCATMFEARPSLLRVDDNLAIPVGFCVVITFFDLSLNYNY